MAKPIWIDTMGILRVVGIISRFGPAKGFTEWVDTDVYTSSGQGKVICRMSRSMGLEEYWLRVDKSSRGRVEVEPGIFTASPVKALKRH